MAKTIGGLSDSTKIDFDEIHARVGSANADETLAALIATYNDVNGVTADTSLDECEVAGFAEATRINARMMAEIKRLLVRRGELQAEAVGEQAKQVEALTARLAERDGIIADRDKTITEQAAELDDLRKKAESVDALTKAMHEAEEAQAKRFDDMMSMLKAQVERYESELDEAKSRVEQMTTERDAAQAKIAEVEQERGVLAEQVRELQKRLADVDQTGQE